jgi:predicted permease
VIDTIARLLARLAASALPRARRAELLDDLAHDLADRRARIGRWRAAWWGLHELLSLVYGYRLESRRQPRTTTSAHSTAVQSLAFAIRSLRRTPATTATVIVMLGLGMGAATAIFSIVNAVLLRPVAGVANPAGVVSLERLDGPGIIDVFSYPDYLDMRTRVASAVELIAFTRTSFDVRGDATERLSGALVSGNYFSVLGVTARLGRTLTPADEGANVVVVSDTCWRRVLGEDPAAVGRAIGINGHPFTVVGVLVPAFTGTYPGQPDTVWLPYSAQPMVMPRMSAGVLHNRNSRWVQIAGRVRAPGSRSTASEIVRAAGQGLAQAFPGDHASGRFTLRPGLGLASDERVEIGRVLSLLGAAAGLLLLISCGNAANLLLARAQARRRELAIRRALGASQGRLAAELIAESAVLAVAASAVGFVMAPLAMAWLIPVPAPGYGLRPDMFTLDRGSLLFAAGVSGALSLALTLMPLLGAERSMVTSALVGGGRTVSRPRTRMRAALVVLQVAFAVCLATGANLAVRTTANIAAVDPGYATRDRVTGQYALDLHGYSPERAVIFFSTITRDMRAQAGIRHASWATAVPPVPYGGRRSVFRRGEAPSQADLQRDEERLGVRADFASVGPDFFETMNITIRAGRSFSAVDRAGAEPVAIINDALARQLWPDGDAEGRYLEAPPYSGAVPPPLRVVGIATNTRHRSLLSDSSVPVLYLPFLQQPDTRATMVLDGYGGLQAMAPLLREVTATIDPDVAPSGVRDITEYDAATVWEQETAAAAFGLFAACALCLAAGGVYASLANDVASRRRELAIRLALGASGRDLARSVVGNAMTVSLAGCASGVAVALAGSRRFDGLLFGVSARDPTALVSAVGLLLLIAAVASALPARRAARTDAAVTLQVE